MKKTKKPEFIISAAGLLVMTAAFVLWSVHTTGTSAAGRIAALISAALFTALCLRFVPVWIGFWRRQDILPTPEGAAAGVTPRYITIKIFIALLAVDAAVVLAVFLLRAALGHGSSFVQALQFWTCTDSQHYLDIARDWYLSEGDWDRLVQLVFLPGYPLAIRAVNLVVGNYLYSAMLTSALAFAGAGCVFYHMLRLDLDHRSALRALKYTCIIPGAFFFAAPMSESLFYLLSVSCVYLARRHKYAAACLLGGLASFTRSLGLALFVPVLFELVSHTVRSAPCRGTPRRAARFLLLLLIPMGFAVYCYVNYMISGDPFKYMEYQSVHWGQHLGLFFNTAAYQLDNAISCFGTNTHNLLGLWLPNLLCSFLSLVIILPAVKKLPASYTAYFIAYYIIAIGATWLLSAPRYLTVLFPIPTALAYLTKKPKCDMLVTVLCAAAYAFYLAAFAMRWQVW